jgi:CBS domain-containing protein
VVAYQLAAGGHRADCRNATFGALLFSDLGHKLSALAERQHQHELQSLTSRAWTRRSCARRTASMRHRHPLGGAAVPGAAHLQRAGAGRGATGRLGIFTATSAAAAILDGRPAGPVAVGELATLPADRNPSDQLGDAMAVMLRHRVHRLVVEEGGQMLGMLEALDLFSYLSNQSHIVITVQIEQAQDLDSWPGRSADHR